MGEDNVLPRLLAALCMLLTLSAPAFAIDTPAKQGAVVPEQGRDDSPGGMLYRQRCAMCHDNPTGRIPARTFLGIIKSPDSIIATLTHGAMRPQAAGLDADQIRAIAVYLTGREPGQNPQPDPQANLCKKPGPAIALDGRQWNGWSPDLKNARYQAQPGLRAEDVKRLKVKWVFAYPDIAYGQPTQVAGRVFVVSRAGWVFSLDAETGCTYWAHDAGAPVRTAVTIGALPASAPARFAAYFGDEKGTVHAVDAMTGKPLWTMVADDHLLARITGSPKFYQGRVYVPVSSMEEVSGGTPKYPCCTARGSLLALDAATGKVVWKSYAIESEPKPTRLNPSGVQMYGPAGGSIWNSPTIDEKRKLIYVGTGDSFTDVPTDSTDSILALDLETGKRVWTTQVKKHDDWLVGCVPGHTPDNCPKNPGPDFDFGASPLLHTLPDGKDIILDGAKSGVVYAFDPDDHGKILWQKKIAEGSSVGAIVWGPAADAEHWYVSIGDVTARPPYAPGGLWAFRPATGDIVWHTPAPKAACSWGTVNCSGAQPGGVTAIPGVVFAGSWDGHIRAYSTKDGAIAWDFDTAQTYDAVNGVKANGGAIDMGGQTIANGLLLVNSGVTPIQRPGNALIAFTVDGK